MNKIKFSLPYPAKQKSKAAFCKQYGLNSIYAGKHWAKRNEDKQYWHLLVLSEISRLEIPKALFEKPAELIFSWDDGLDCSNHAYMAKMIEDSLVGAFLHDDNRQWVKKITHEFNSDGVITVEIKEFLQ